MVMGVTGLARDAQLAAGYARWYAGTWKLAAWGVALFLAGFWPLLAFRRHWTTTGPVSCAQVPSGADSCSYDEVSGTWSGTWVQTAGHSAVTPLGVWVTVAWLGLVAAGFAVLAVGWVRRRPGLL